ncbi:MAG: ATP-dependent DNA helicase [Crenarchaeota archaeon]|nr:ATP-dependent DNA helicase [Thermoproteota archaeon]
MSYPLNNRQLEAVEHTGSPLLVTAGPGSGKTSVITERIKFLVRDGMDPSAILCLTFSEKAAESIKKKLEEDKEIIATKTDVSSMRISTYHSFCWDFLLENTVSTGLGMHGGIIDRATLMVWGVLNIDKFGFDRHIEIGNNANEIIEKMIDGISSFNDELLTPKDIADYVAKKISGVDPVKDVEEYETIHNLDNLQRMYEKYVEFKRSIDAMDFDDLIVEANKLLADPNKDYILQKMKAKYGHILVDEFQDNNYAQFALVKKIAGKNNVTAVGDPDQNIYRFQGSYTEIFHDFRSTFPNYKEVFLTKNYRNPQHVINFASEMIGQDGYRTLPPEAFESENIVDNKVNIVQCPSELVQAEFVKNKIGELRKANGYKWKDFAILSRKQRDGLNVAQLLVSEGIPTRYTGKADIHTASKAKLVFSFLRIISDSMNSMVSINRVLQEYGISEINISRINLEASKRARNKDDGDHCLEVISDQDVEELTQKTEVKEVYNLIQKFIKIAKDNTVSDTLYKIIRNETDVYKSIANDDRIESSIERSILLDIINSAYDLESINRNATIADYLDFVEHLIKFDVETNRGDDDDDAVQVSTVHQSKGLEYKVVFVIDVATRKFPLKWSEKMFYVPPEISNSKQPASGDAKVEFQREERRILYVGLTRALEYLFVTYPIRYTGNAKGNKESKYLQDIKPNVSNGGWAKHPNVNYVEPLETKSKTAPPVFDAIEIIKKDRTERVEKLILSGQWQSAIQVIADLAKIEHYKTNKNLDKFDESAYPTGTGENIEEVLNGTRSERKKFTDSKLSFSAIDPYETCPKQFWYAQVLKILPESREATALVKGTLYHSIVENATIKQKNTGVAEELKTLQAELGQRWPEAGRAYLKQPKSKENQDKNSLEPALYSFAEWTSTTKNTIVSTEFYFSTNIGGMKFTGKIDRVDMNPEGNFEIIDYKTGGKKKVIDKINESLQLNLYAIAVAEEIQKKRPFDIEIPAGEDWSKKIVKSASFFYPEKDHGLVDSTTGKAEGQWFDYEINDVDVANARKKIEVYLKDINNMEFDATPENFSCKYCNYNDICDESEATKQWQ